MVLDVAKTQVYHFMEIVIAGLGFFTDAYNLFLQLGRKNVYRITLILMVLCSIASDLSFGNSSKGVMTTLFFLVKSTIMSEYGNKTICGTFTVVRVHCARVGILAEGIVALIFSSIFDHQFSSEICSDYLWRIILMVENLPAAMTYYWLMKMSETARYTALVAKNIKQATQDMAKVLQVDLEAEEEIKRLLETLSLTMYCLEIKYGLFFKEFLRRHGLSGADPGLPLLGTSSTWFLLDIMFYSQTLFQKDISSTIGWIPNAATMNAIQEVYKIGRAQTLITLCIIIYSLTFFVANFGPDATIFVFPAEIFPARLRSTCHGISAAAGKAGAIDKTKMDAGYPPSIGVKNFFFGVINFVGMIMTFLVPASKGKSLEELSAFNNRDK
ncbi:hypothetical protein EUTSA_v10003348mg [Eutrema salsugineum]|uniref:Major facilitator superfamily (MFS) profile domain-containing protein n=1 Tax=Eutrema salsugineum TaxID=72664 RepID=V4L308_EUTSA|nr:hypothetical protein EUTSA_v10003348mg [Eutrema salsugineum]